MKLSQIEQVLEVARVGSITQAAHNLYTSQPNLSQSIHKIEEEVGTPLFQRNSTGVELTTFGQRFVAQCREISQQLSYLDDMCRAQSQAPALELSIASGGYLFLQQEITNLYKKHANAPVHIYYRELDADTMRNMVVGNELELAFLSIWSHEKKRILKKFNNFGLEFHFLTDAIPGIYISRTSPTYPKELDVVDPALLRNMPYISTREMGEQLLMIMQTIFEGEDLATVPCLRSTLHLTSRDAMSTAVVETNGFAIGTYCASIYDRFTFDPNLRFIPLPGDHFKTEVGWMQRANHVRSVLAEELISDLRYMLI